MSWFHCSIFARIGGTNTSPGMVPGSRAKARRHARPSMSCGSTTLNGSHIARTSLLWGCFLLRSRRHDERPHCRISYFIRSAVIPATRTRRARRPSARAVRPPHPYPSPTPRGRGVGVRGWAGEGYACRRDLTGQLSFALVFIPHWRDQGTMPRGSEKSPLTVHGGARSKAFHSLGGLTSLLGETGES